MRNKGRDLLNQSDLITSQDAIILALGELREAGANELVEHLYARAYIPKRAARKQLCIMIDKGIIGIKPNLKLFLKKA